MGLLGFLISWGLTDQEGRRSILMQRAGNSRSSVFFPPLFLFAFFHFFPQPPPSKMWSLYFGFVSFPGLPFMTVRLQVQSPFSLSTFSP